MPVALEELSHSSSLFSPKLKLLFQITAQHKAKAVTDAKIALL